ncbi:hypothetical protein SLS62_001508 [Diatrype stigma]|uniref:Uncharacterized protein n=1 Tax=Diatrype stigma TaxID=117547 RepID=A0AAN9UZL3_9PEZI
MPPKKRGRPAKKHAQPAASDAPATPAATVRTSSAQSPALSSPILKRRSPSAGSIAEALPPRKKRGRPRKQQPVALVRVHSSLAGEGPAENIELISTTSQVKVIKDSQEDDDADGDIGGDKPAITATTDGFTQGLKDAMREIFIGNAMEQNGGLWIPHEAALQMQQVFAPMLPLPAGAVFVAAGLVEAIREHLTLKQK